MVDEGRNSVGDGQMNEVVQGVGTGVHFPSSVGWPGIWRAAVPSKENFAGYYPSKGAFWCVVPIYQALTCRG